MLIELLVGVQKLKIVVTPLVGAFPVAVAAPSASKFPSYERLSAEPARSSGAKPLSVSPISVHAVPFQWYT